MRNFPRLLRNTWRSFKGKQHRSSPVEGRDRARGRLLHITEVFYFWCPIHQLAGGGVGVESNISQKLKNSEITVVS